MQSVLDFAAEPRLDAMLHRLRVAYGAAPPRRQDAVRQLVYALISDGLAPTVGLAIFRRLSVAFPTPARLGAASAEDLLPCFAGLADGESRAARLAGVLAAIVSRCGALELDLLSRLATEPARRFLCELPGVTAAQADAVLTLSDLRRAGVAINADSARPVRRLGLAEAGAPLSALARQVGERAPAAWHTDDFAALTAGLASLARAVCHAGRPDCAACPLADLCPTAPQRPAAVIPFPGRGRLSRQGDGQNAPRSGPPAPPADSPDLAPRARGPRG